MDLSKMDISPEMRKKVKACKSSEELLALAKSEGHKLTEDELAAISGGGNWNCTRDDICWTHESGT